MMVDQEGKGDVVTAMDTDCEGDLKDALDSFERTFPYQLGGNDPDIDNYNASTAKPDEIVYYLSGLGVDFWYDYIQKLHLDASGPSLIPLLIIT